MPGAMPAPSDRRPRARSSAFRQAAIFLCTLLIASGALELHNLANHHRAIEVGGLFDPAGAQQALVAYPSSASPRGPPTA